MSDAVCHYKPMDTRNKSDVMCGCPLLTNQQSQKGSDVMYDGRGHGEARAAHTRNNRQRRDVVGVARLWVVAASLPHSLAGWDSVVFVYAETVNLIWLVSENYPCILYYRLVKLGILEWRSERWILNEGEGDELPSRDSVTSARVVCLSVWCCWLRSYEIVCVPVWTLPFAWNTYGYVIQLMGV